MHRLTHLAKKWLYNASVSHAAIPLVPEDPSTPTRYLYLFPAQEPSRVANQVCGELAQRLADEVAALQLEKSEQLSTARHPTEVRLASFQVPALLLGVCVTLLFCWAVCKLLYNSYLWLTSSALRRKLAAAEIERRQLGFRLEEEAVAAAAVGERVAELLLRQQREKHTAERLSAEIADLTESNSQLQTEVDGLQSQRKNLLAERDDNHQQLMATEVQLADLVQQRSEKQVAVAKQSRALREETQQKIEQFNQAVVRANQQILQVEGELRKVESRLAETEQAVREKISRCAAMERQAEVTKGPLQLEVERLQAQKAALVSEIQSDQRHLAAAQDFAQRAQAEVASVQLETTAPLPRHLTTLPTPMTALVVQPQGTNAPNPLVDNQNDQVD